MPSTRPLTELEIEYLRLKETARQRELTPSEDIRRLTLKALINADHNWRWNGRVSRRPKRGRWGPGEAPELTESQQLTRLSDGTWLCRRRT